MLTEDVGSQSKRSMGVPLCETSGKGSIELLLNNGANTEGFPKARGSVPWS